MNLGSLRDKKNKTSKLIFCCQFLSKFLKKTGELVSYGIHYFKFLILTSMWKFTYLFIKYKLWCNLFIY